MTRSVVASVMGFVAERTQCRKRSWGGGGKGAEAEQDRFVKPKRRDVCARRGKRVEWSEGTLLRPASVGLGLGWQC